MDRDRAALGDAYHDLRALGWARLANAHRLSMDFPSAEENFARSDEAWAAPRQRPDHVIEAEILALKATLRSDQRYFDQAKAFLDHAIPLCQQFLEDSQLLIKCLIQRAKLLDYLGDHQAAISDLDRARTLLKDRDEPYLKAVAAGNLATSYTWAGEHEKALEVLPQAKAQCEAINNRLGLHQLLWIEGLARQGLGDTAAAEALFQEARAGLIELREMGYAALASLELALCRHHQGRSSEVLSLAAEALQVLEPLELDADAGAAFRLLGEAIEACEVPLAVLEEARDALRNLYRDPTDRLRRAS